MSKPRIEARLVSACEKALDAAVHAGKFAPARKGHYRKMFYADPEGTQALLAQLAPVLPVGRQEIGRGNLMEPYSPAHDPDEWPGRSEWLRRSEGPGSGADAGPGRVMTDELPGPPGGANPAGRPPRITVAND